MVKMQTPVLLDDWIGVVQAGKNIEERHQSKRMEQEDGDDQNQWAFK